MNNQMTNLDSIFKNAISELIDEKFSSLVAVIENLSSSNQPYPEYMTIGLACKYIDVSRNTLSKYIDDYGLPVMQIEGIKRIAKSDIDSFMLSHSI
ncbi:helix-turn-helix domain-containing protein [Vagococcus fluvialis]|uniref:helix-turn-helix domain-containing protein n=1 Tax=Vagococcus fluvialis TaxID=2738 RepID=UPI003B5BF02F